MTLYHYDRRAVADASGLLRRTLQRPCRAAEPRRLLEIWPGGLDLDWNRVNLGRRMAGALMDLPNSIGARRLGHAPHHPGLRVAPRALEVDTFLVLNVEVRLVGLLQGFGGHAVIP
jgi:hypothetical protein